MCETCLLHSAHGPSMEVAKPSQTTKWEGGYGWLCRGQTFSRPMEGGSPLSGVFYELGIEAQLLKWQKIHPVGITQAALTMSAEGLKRGIAKGEAPGG